LDKTGQYGKLKQSGLNSLAIVKQNVRHTFRHKLGDKVRRKHYKQSKPKM
jgi:hypothetical protein